MFNAVIKVFVWHAQAKVWEFGRFDAFKLLKLLGAQSFGSKDGNTIKGTNLGNELKNNYN